MPISHIFIDLIVNLTTFKKRGLKYILLASLSCLALFSMKRSVMAQIIIGGFFYILVQNIIIEQKKKVLFIFLTPFVLLGLFLILSYVNRSTSGELVGQLQGQGQIDTERASLRPRNTRSTAVHVARRGQELHPLLRNSRAGRPSRRVLHLFNGCSRALA